MAAQNPMAGISGMIQQIKEQEQIVTQENRRLKQLIAIQDALIKKQREGLLEVAKTASELAAIEQERTKLRNKLNSQKTKLLVSAAETSDASSLIENTLAQSGPTEAISSGATGAATLKAIEVIQSQLFSLTEACLKNQDLSVPPEAVSDLISNVNEVIQKTIDNGIAKESAEDTIRRQNFVITSLVPEPEDEAEEE